MFRSILCRIFGLHSWAWRDAKNGYFYYSGVKWFDCNEERICIFCHVYYKDNIKIRDNFYDQRTH